MLQLNNALGSEKSTCNSLSAAILFCNCLRIKQGIHRVPFRLEENTATARKKKKINKLSKAVTQMQAQDCKTQHRMWSRGGIYLKYLIQQLVSFLQKTRVIEKKVKNIFLLHPWLILKKVIVNQCWYIFYVIKAITYRELLTLRMTSHTRESQNQIGKHLWGPQV